jgi:RNA polymerase sigma-70 factor (ECF subfamily)
MSRAEADHVLIRQCQKGDKSALDALISQYEQRAYQYAFRLTRDPEEAADVVADAFVRVYTAIQNFRGHSAFSTWLYRIVTNVYFDHRKKDRSKVLVSLDAPVGPQGEGRVVDVPDPAGGPGAAVEAGARAEAIQRALGSLPEFQHAMLVMFHLEGLSYVEIAEALDLPVGTVKSRLNRARLALRQELAQEMELFDV